MLQLRVVRVTKQWTLWHLAQRARVSIGRLRCIERALIEATEEEKEEIAAAINGRLEVLFQPVQMEELIQG